FPTSSRATACTQAVPAHALSRREAAGGQRLQPLLEYKQWHNQRHLAELDPEVGCNGRGFAAGTAATDLPEPPRGQGNGEVGAPHVRGGEKDIRRTRPLSRSSMHRLPRVAVEAAGPSRR